MDMDIDVKSLLQESICTIIASEIPLASSFHYTFARRRVSVNNVASLRDLGIFVYIRMVHRRLASPI